MNSNGFFDTHVYAECGTELRSFRVPVTQEMTVRSFAQDALARFVKQTRFAAAVEVAVQDVRVSGISLFYNDPVCAVVGPNERLEVHVLGVKAGDVAPRRLAVGSGVASAAVSPDLVAPGVIAITAGAGGSKQALAASSTAEEETSSSAADDASAPKGKRARDTPGTEIAQAAQKQPAAASEAKQPATGRTRSSKAAAAMPDDATDEILEASRKNELGWGAEAHKNFASNYVSDPDAMIRAIRKKKREEAKAAKEAAAKEAASADGDVTFVKETAAAKAAGGPSSSSATSAAPAARKSQKTTTSKAAMAALPAAAMASGGSADALVSKAAAGDHQQAKAAAAAVHPAPAVGGLGLGVGADYRPVGVARMLDFAGEEE